MFKEAEKYIKNVEKIFGSFRFAPPKTALIEGKLDTEHLDYAIPGFRDQNLRPQQNESNNLDHESTNLENLAETLATVSQIEVKCEPNQDQIPQPYPLTEQRRISIRMPTSFIEELQFCRDYLATLNHENESLQAENTQLKDEIKTLRMQSYAQRKKN